MRFGKWIVMGFFGLVFTIADMPIRLLGIGVLIGTILTSWFDFLYDKIKNQGNEE